MTVLLDAPGPVTVDGLPVGRSRAGDNHRQRFDPAALAALAKSIDATGGLVQPVTVRPVEGDPAADWELVAGERRWRAHLLLGWPEIRATIVTADDEAAETQMLAENTGRVDLSPVEEARGYRRGIDRFGWTVEQVAAKAGVAVFRVNWRLDLLRLRDDIAGLVDTGNFPTSYGRALRDLDFNRQGIAFAAYRDRPGITLPQFQAVCDRLLADQQQDSLFDTATFLQVDEWADAAVASVAASRPSRASLVDLIARLAAELDVRGGDPVLVDEAQRVER